jgi:DNA-binding MurR/RpiR family transcriptional regulator
MAFQLGVNGVSKFKNALAHAKDHAWDKCADELLSSRWHQQTPNRAKALADVMRGK